MNSINACKINKISLDLSSIKTITITTKEETYEFDCVQAFAIINKIVKEMLDSCVYSEDEDGPFDKYEYNINL